METGFNQKDLEMLWCASEEQLFQFGENNKTDPRFKQQDWAILLKRIEINLAELSARTPKDFRMIKAS